MHEQVQDEV